MALAATPITCVHEFVLPHSSGLELPGPWTTISVSNGVALQYVQNTTPGPQSVDTGTGRGSLTLQPGDALFAWGNDSFRQVMRLPHSGNRIVGHRSAYAGVNFTQTGTAPSGQYAVAQGEILVAGRGLRGSCMGSGTGTASIAWSMSNPVPGLPLSGSATAIGQQPAGDEAGNIGVGIAGQFLEGGLLNNLDLGGGASGPCNLSVFNVNLGMAVVLETEPLEFGARVRAAVSEDAGSLFQATQAVAVELGLSEAFAYGEDIPAGQLRPFREALTPEEVAVSYYPLPTRNQEMLVTVEGETNLGRMASTYPERIMVPARDLPGQVNDRVTAQQAIQYVVAQWSAQHPWLVFEPIPDFRFVMPGALAAPRQYYVDNPTAGVLTIGAVTIEQDGNSRRTMREILDEWVSVFPGTVLRQTSRGTIELVPRVGPDAPDGVAVTLGWRDLKGISDGTDDPRGVVNLCRVTSQGWEFREGEALASPSFVVFRGEGGLARSVLEAEEVLPIDSRQEFQPWEPLRFSVLSTPAPITVDVGLTAFGSHHPTVASSFSIEGTRSEQVTISAGQSRLVSITHTSRAQSVTARFRITRSVEGDSITVTAPNGIPARATNPFGSTYLAYEVTLDVTGTGWARTNEAIESEFGLVSDSLPGAGGGDALAESRAQYGERLATINSSVFQLTPEQARQIAESYVLWNINPRTIRDVQQSEWDPYPVKFDHIGRYVDLPTGERAVVENRAYSDSFSAMHAAMQSAFSATVSEVVIDTTTSWLYLDNGDFFELDDGTPVERS